MQDTGRVLGKSLFLRRGRSIGACSAYTENSIHFKIQRKVTVIVDKMKNCVLHECLLWRPMSSCDCAARSATWRGRGQRQRRSPTRVMGVVTLSV